MSNFLNILYLSVFFSLEDNRQASKWGVSPIGDRSLSFTHPPFASLSRRPLGVASALRACQCCSKGVL